MRVYDPNSTLVGENYYGDTDYSDYTSVSRIHYYYNETSSDFTITATDDGVWEGSKKLWLSFGPLPVGVVAGPQNTATVTITDQ